MLSILVSHVRHDNRSLASSPLTFLVEQIFIKSIIETLKNENTRSIHPWISIPDNTNKAVVRTPSVLKPFQPLNRA